MLIGAIGFNVSFLLLFALDVKSDRTALVTSCAWLPFVATVATCVIAGLSVPTIAFWGSIAFAVSLLLLWRKVRTLHE